MRLRNGSKTLPGRRKRIRREMRELFLEGGPCKTESSMKEFAGALTVIYLKMHFCWSISVFGLNSLQFRIKSTGLRLQRIPQKGFALLSDLQWVAGQ